MTSSIAIAGTATPLALANSYTLSDTVVLKNGKKYPSIPIVIPIKTITSRYTYEGASQEIDVTGHFSDVGNPSLNPYVNYFPGGTLTGEITAQSLSDGSQVVVFNSENGPVNLQTTNFELTRNVVTKAFFQDYTPMDGSGATYTQITLTAN